MAAIVITRDFVAVSSGNQIKTYSLTCDDVQLLETPENVCSNDKKKANDRNGRILCMKFSPCAKYFAASNDKKQLVVWETSNWQLINSRFINKQASQLCFTQNKEILVADRCGDVYLHGFRESNNESRFVIGRISLLLDLVLSVDGRFLITSDRDEKICVSNFPNSYNIQSYCLGHTEFVSCVSLLSLNSDVLVSSSGDGTIRFWDFKSGVEKLCIDCAKEKGYDMKCDRSTRLSEMNSKTNAIKKCICMPNRNIVAVIYFSYSCVELYSVEINEESFSHSHIQTLSFPNIPFDAAFDENGRLWVVIPDKTKPINIFKLSNEENLEFVTEILEKNIKLNEDCEFFEEAGSSPTDISMMFKQWFDNVGEYLQKKEARIKVKHNKRIKTLK
uniref:tRNA (guanine-N(7)-)-methyltransferase non-catalytic subunit n=1 Tax=Strigamia maritima TaxID=126957 RepID=T1IH29_STRMM